MKRRLDLDLTRVGCMCAVVYLHAAYNSFGAPDGSLLWLTSHLINLFASLAVPLFFMMSGALTLSARSSADPRAVLCRRVPRVLIPLAAWSAVMLAYTGVTQGWDAARTGLLGILHAPANTAYWFLYALIPMYLLLPALRPMAERLSRTQWRYLLLLWLCLTLGLPTLRAFLPSVWQEVLTEHWTLNLNAVGGYLGYFLLGAYLDRLETPPRRSVLLWGTLAAALAVFAATWLDSVHLGAYSHRFTDYLCVFTALRAAGVFLLMKSLFGARPSRSPVLVLLSNCSFGVYLAHPLVLLAGGELWGRLTGSYLLGSLSRMSVFYLLALACGVLLALVLSSIPGLSWMCTGRRFRDTWRDASLWGLFPRRGQRPTDPDHPDPPFFLDNRGEDG